MPKRPIVPEDIRSIRFADSVLPSPDGTLAVYEIRTIDAEKDTYDTHLWMIPLAGGAPRQLTFGERKNSGATWSPDGRSIAFVSTRRDKVPQIYRLSLDGGEAERLTDLDGDVSSLEWSPDGRSIAFLYRENDAPGQGHLPDTVPLKKAIEAKAEKKELPPPTYRHITRSLYKLDGVGWLPRSRSHVHVLDVARRETRAITSGDFEDGGAVWSPDSTMLAFTANRQEDEEYSAYSVSDVFVVPAAGGEPRNITPQPGIATAPAWSPDGKSIAFLGHDQAEDWWGIPNYHVWVVPAAGGPAKDLTPAFDRTATDLVGSDLRDFHSGGNPVWSRDGKTIYFLGSEFGSTHIYSVASVAARRSA